MTPVVDTEEPRANDGAPPSFSHTPSTPPTPAARKRVRHWRTWRTWRRLTLWPLLSLLLVLALAVAALWVWAGTQGSLATALAWAGRWTPLVAQGVRGDIRHGGTVEHLTWAQDGLRVQVDGARLAWSPGALLHRQLDVRELAAARIEIEDRRPPSPPSPSAGPPQSLALPLAVRVDALQVGLFQWAGPPAVTVREVAASYRYQGNQHALTLTRARVETEEGSADLGARVALQANAPVTLDAALQGALRSRAAPPLAAQVTLRGPLTDLQVGAGVGVAGAGAQGASAAAPAAATPAAPAVAAASATLQARVTPWAKQPLPEAHARVERIDLRTLLAAFWPDAPRTSITGQIDLAPTSADGWHGVADLTNAETSLPIARARADLDWQGRTLTVHALDVSGADSALSAHGQWQVDAAAGAGEATLTAPGLALALRGDAAPDHGAGHAQIDVRDAAHLLAWAGALPGLDAALAHLPGAQGEVHLVADWRGGWRDAQSAAVQATLNVPTLALSLPDASASAGRQDLRAQNVRLSLNGTLAQAQLALQGNASLGERRGALRLTAHGGRAVAGSAGSGLGSAASVWRLSIDSLNTQAQDPKLGAWTLASAAPVALTLGPGRALEVGAGTLTLAEAQPIRDAQTGADQAHGGKGGAGNSAAPHVTLAWDASRWDGRALATSGRVTGLSFAWVDRFAGASLRDAGITGDVALAGAWRARVGPGQPLDVHASLERTAGDLTLTANDPPTGLRTRVAAGLSEARMALDASGDEVRAQVRWMSERAGQINADLRTQITPTPDGSWAWPEAAPLTGQLSAKLPQLSAWSALAPPGWRMRGVLAADARIAGTRADPQVTGTLTADRLALRSVVDGVQLRGGQLRAHFDGARLIIDAFSLHGAGWRSGARDGSGPNGQGGLLTATGEAGWIDGRAQARLDATLDHLRASIRPDRQMTVSGKLQAALDGQLVTARGQIDIDEARIELPDQSAPTLSDDVVVHDAHDRALRGQVTTDAGPKKPVKTAAKTPETASTAPEKTPTPDGSGSSEGEGGLRADVQVAISLGEQFRVQGQGIDTQLRGALTLAAQGPLTALPKLTGVINTVDGRFHAYGQNLNIARGVIRFTGAMANPTLDIIALRPIYESDQKAGVLVQGTAQLPRVRLYSDPALPDSQTLAWLLLGHAAPATGAESAMLQSAALALLGGRDSPGLASRLGLDALSLDNTSDASGAQNTSVTLGKRLTNRLYAAYQQSLSGTTGSLLIFYELSRRWQLRAQAGQNAAVDLIYSLSFD